MANWYVDAAAAGANDGTSWVDAWSTFEAVVWGTAAGVTGGDTLYISGTTYSSALNIATSGTAASMLMIDVGANSPSPTGHDGIVTIDVASAENCLNVIGYDYVQVNGLYSGSLRWQMTNAIGNTSGGSGTIKLQNASYVTIQYIDIDNPSATGIFATNIDNSYIRGCDVRTGNVVFAAQCDGIYIQYGNDNVIEYNTVVLGNSDPANHMDCVQVTNQEDRLIVRGNWLEWTSGRGNSQCQTFIIEDLGDAGYFYNNVVLGCSENPDQAALFKEADPGGVYYCWNNTIISQSAAGVALNMGVCEDAEIGAIKNNIIYSPNDYALWVQSTQADVTKIDNNCLYRSTGTAIVFVGGEKTWAAYQAAGYDADGLNVPPQYDSGDEYRLLAVSSCIDSATSLAAYFTVDKDQKTRPVGSAWDMGAYEYGTTTGVKYVAFRR